MHYLCSWRLLHWSSLFFPQPQPAPAWTTFRVGLYCGIFMVLAVAFVLTGTVFNLVAHSDKHTNYTCLSIYTTVWLIFPSQVLFSFVIRTSGHWCASTAAVSFWFSFSFSWGLTLMAGGRRVSIMCWSLSWTPETIFHISICLRWDASWRRKLYRKSLYTLPFQSLESVRFFNSFESLLFSLRSK